MDLAPSEKPLRRPRVKAYNHWGSKVSSFFNELREIANEHFSTANLSSYSKSKARERVWKVELVEKGDKTR